MVRSALHFAGRVFVAAVAVAVVRGGLIRAEGGFNDHGRREQRRPVYQRHAFDWMDAHSAGRRRDHGHAPQWVAPPVSSGWFQRPYPYHLDYYKMRYGGSYAPYFGNLYGPPQVVTAPPYYGPYYGGYESGYLPANGASGLSYATPVEERTVQEQDGEPPAGDSLPPPARE